MCNRIVSPARKLGFVSFHTAFLNTASFVTHELQCFVLTDRLMIRRRTLDMKTPRDHHSNVTCCLRVNQNGALHGLPFYTPLFVTGITQQLET